MNAFEQVELKLGVVHFGKQTNETVESGVVIGSSRVDNNGRQ